MNWSMVLVVYSCLLCGCIYVRVSLLMCKRAQTVKSEERGFKLSLSTFLFSFLLFSSLLFSSLRCSALICSLLYGILCAILNLRQSSAVSSSNTRFQFENHPSIKFSSKSCNYKMGWFSSSSMCSSSSSSSSSSSMCRM